ncbi:MAG: hypothetical protein M5U34_16595 [Chloroflexi bacterium]|nr:hypothetical protein [Chloroflexota bacterium]
MSYEVFLSLGETEPPVWVGMTANAHLLTDSFENVLLVPNEAINVDRNKGVFSVNRAITDANGKQTYEEVFITIGRRDGANTQILTGLAEGG